MLRPLLRHSPRASRRTEAAPGTKGTMRGPRPREADGPKPLRGRQGGRTEAPAGQVRREVCCGKLPARALPTAAPSLASSIPVSLHPLLSLLFPGVRRRAAQGEAILCCTVVHSVCAEGLKATVLPTCLSKVHAPPLRRHLRCDRGRVCKRRVFRSAGRRAPRKEPACLTFVTNERVRPARIARLPPRGVRALTASERSALYSWGVPGTPGEYPSAGV